MSLVSVGLADAAELGDDGVEVGFAAFGVRAFLELVLEVAVGAETAVVRGGTAGGTVSLFRGDTGLSTSGERSKALGYGSRGEESDEDSGETHVD